MLLKLFRIEFTTIYKVFFYVWNEMHDKIKCEIAESLNVDETVECWICEKVKRKWNDNISTKLLFDTWYLFDDRKHFICSIPNRSGKKERMKRENKIVFFPRSFSSIAIAKEKNNGYRP